MSGGNSIIQLLLDKGFGVDEEGPFGAPLRAACLTGHLSTFQLLLDAGANVNLCSSFGDALQTASLKGHAQIAKILIQAGLRTRNEGGLYGNAFRAAAYNGRMEFIRVLAVAEAGSEDSIKLLIERGCE